MKNKAKFKKGYEKHGRWRMFDNMLRNTKQSKPIVTEKGMVLWGKPKDEKDKQFKNNYRKRQIKIQNYSVKN